MPRHARGPAALEVRLIRGAESADRRLKGQQAAAYGLRIPSVGPAGSTLGVHCRASIPHRGEYIRDPSTLVLIWGHLAQRVQQLRQVISPALEVRPSGARVRGGHRARRFCGAHRIVQGGTFRVRVDDPGLPFVRNCRAAARGAGDPHDHTDEGQGADNDPEPDKGGTGFATRCEGTAGLRTRCGCGSAVSCRWLHSSRCARTGR